MSVGQLLQLATLKSNRYLGLWFSIQHPHRACALSDSIYDYCCARQKHSTQMTHDAIGRPFSHSLPKSTQSGAIQIGSRFCPFPRSATTELMNKLWLLLMSWGKTDTAALTSWPAQSEFRSIWKPFRKRSQSNKWKTIIWMPHYRISGKCRIRSSCSNRKHSLARSSLTWSFWSHNFCALLHSHRRILIIFPCAQNTFSLHFQCEWGHIWFICNCINWAEGWIADFPPSQWINNVFRRRAILIEHGKMKQTRSWKFNINLDGGTYSS